MSTKTKQQETPTREELEQRIAVARPELEAIDTEYQQTYKALERARQELPTFDTQTSQLGRFEEQSIDRLNQARQQHKEASAAYTRPEFGAATLASLKDKLKASEEELARITLATEKQLAGYAKDRENLAQERKDHEKHIADLENALQEIVSKSNSAAASYQADMAALGRLLYTEHMTRYDQLKKELQAAREAEEQARQSHASAQYAFNKAREEALNAMHQWPHLRTQFM